MSGEKDQFLVDPALNVSYGGGPSTKLSRMRLRLLKEELKHNPDIGYVKDAVREFIPGMQSELNFFIINEILPEL